MGQEVRKSPEISENRPKSTENQGLLGQRTEGIFQIGKETVEFRSDFAAKTVNTSCARGSQMKGARAKMAGIFPDFLARGPKVGPILWKSPGFFSRFPQNPHTRGLKMGRFSRNLRDFSRFPLARERVYAHAPSRAAHSKLFLGWL